MSQVGLVPSFKRHLNQQNNLQNLLTVLNSRTYTQSALDVKSAQATGIVDASGTRALLTGKGYEAAFFTALTQLLPVPAQPGQTVPHHISGDNTDSILTKTVRNQAGEKPDGTGLEYGVTSASYSSALFFGELSYQKHITQLSSPQSTTIHKKHMKLLMDISCLLRERPLAAHAFGFSFFCDVFTFVGVTREDILYFEVDQWSANDNFGQVIEAINFLRYTPRTQLFGVPLDTTTSWSDAASGMTSIALGECFAAHHRDFGTASAVFQSTVPDAVVKAVWVNTNNLRSLAASPPEPMEVHVMRRINAGLLASTDPEVLKYASCFPKLLAAHSAVLNPQAANRSLWFIVMEGRGEVVSRRSVQNIKEMVQLFDDIVQAYIVLNMLGVAHRDVSFSNFLVKRNAEGRLHPFIIDFGASSFVKPGSDGESDNDPSWDTQDSVTMTPACGAFAICVSSHSGLYHFHPRQDLESIHYLLARMMINLLLPPKEKDRSAQSECNDRSTQETNEAVSEAKLVKELTRQVRRLYRKAKASSSAASSSRSLNPIDEAGDCGYSVLAESEESLAITCAAHLLAQLRAIGQFVKFAVTSSENSSLFAEVDAELSKIPREAITAKKLVGKFLMGLASSGSVIPSWEEKDHWRSLGTDIKLELVREYENGIAGQSQAAPGTCADRGDVRKRNKERKLFEQFQEGKALVKDLDQKWLAGAEKLQALSRELLDCLNDVDDESFATWSEWDE